MPDVQQTLQGETAAVVAAHPLATKVGEAILQNGGNAVDAAIATQFALTVVYPRAGNIGGGGFMVVRMADGKVDALDFREKAPAAASRTMYQDTAGNVLPRKSRYGHQAVGVPGTVDGMVRAHERYGSLPWEQLLEPAIILASTGFELPASEAERLNAYMDEFRSYNAEDNPFVTGGQWAAGEVIRQPQLAETLVRIRSQKREGFYGGATAKAIVAEMQRDSGLITSQDLQSYQAVWRQPVTANYKNYRIISMPPPSSGGVALIQLMKMIEPYPIAEYGMHDPRAIHLMAEAERRVYADRATYLGDPDFYEVPVDSLTDSLYIADRMADFDSNEASVSESIVAGEFALLRESFETTHTSIVDAAGNAVSLTTTLNSNYGSKVFVHGAGFFLNNEMDDFSAKPGVPNQFGLVGGEANAIAPGKRMLSSMTPTIVEKDSALYMVLGAPGGSTIITAVFQTLVNVIEFGKPLPEAVAAGRFHHQWLPDQLIIEESVFPDSVQQELITLGQLDTVSRMAIIKAVLNQGDSLLIGAGDPRSSTDDVAAY